MQWRSWIGTGKFDVVDFVAKFLLSLNRVIDTASATTGWVDPQGVALALFLKQKKSEPRQFTCANKVFVFHAALLTLGRNKKATQGNCGCR